MQERGGHGGRGGAKAKKEVVEAIVPEQYKTFVDDRKSSKGDENDMYMLKTHGFNKYRHLSKSFMKRNNHCRLTHSPMDDVIIMAMFDTS
jgi:hypothetical protein